MKGKKVLIVGGSSGIGLSLAKKVEDQGGEVIIASRTAQEARERIQAESGLTRFKCFSVDITVESDIIHLFEQVGSIDHLVMTVKAPLVVDDFLQLNSKDVRRAFEAKFWGQYNVAKFAYEYISKDGSITFTSGTLGARPYNGYSTMSALSGAIESLSKSLAIELAPIRVNAVCPGFKSLAEMEDKIPLGLGSAEQMASPYLFLMNDDYVTGTSIVSDGGAMIA